MATDIVTQGQGSKKVMEAVVTSEQMPFRECW